MRKYIGVIGAAADDEVLKRGALLCDELLCNSVADGARRAIDLGILRVDLPEVRQRVLEQMPDDLYPNAEGAVTGKRKEIVDIVAIVKQAAGHLRGSISTDTPAEAVSQLRVAVDHTLMVMSTAIDELHNISTRLECELLRLGNIEDVFIPLTYGTGLPRTVLGAKASVATIALHRLPLPDADTPWEAIAEWKSDSEAVEKYRTLRAWIARVASENVSVADIEEELIAQLTTYEQYMALQHRKLRRGRVEAIVLPIAGALEDLVHFRFSNAAERLFAIFKQEIVLLESELIAPGREVAYIASTNRRFA